MRVRLFGKTNDDKGSQLEQLTRRLLERLGYKDVTLNFVGSGGSEIDIHGELPLPTLAGNKHIVLIGECKAYEATINLPDWLKFLGKVFTERTCRRTDTRGVFVALSGANGNVMGAYDDLRLRDDTIELITGSRLTTLLAEELRLGKIEDVQHLTSTLTSDTVTEISLTYYGGEGYWIVEFSNSSFAVLTGSRLQDHPPVDVLTLFGKNVQAMKYRDLFAEGTARSRHVLARKFVLGQLLIGGELTSDAWSALLIPEPSEPLTDEELYSALTELRNEGTVIGSGNIHQLANLQSDLVLRGSILRELVNGFFILAYLQAPQWSTLFDEPLLDESLRIKDDLIIPSPDRRKMLTLLGWSPSALLWALSPDEMLCGHKNEPPEVRERLQPEHARYYELQIMQYAASDFRSGPISAVLFQKHGLRELDIQRKIQFKSQTGVEVDLELNERFGLGRFEANLGGGIGLIWLVADAPNPWDAYHLPSDAVPADSVKSKNP